MSRERGAEERQRDGRGNEGEGEEADGRKRRREEREPGRKGRKVKLEGGEREELRGVSRETKRIETIRNDKRGREKKEGSAPLLALFIFTLQRGEVRWRESEEERQRADC